MSENERRKIAHIRIRDVLAIEELELPLNGEGLQLSGRMASGKTSVLDAVSAAFGKSRRSEMLRQGTERGELLIVLDDGHQISREITPDGLSKPTVRKPDGSLMSKPADFLSRLAPAIALNPVEFLQANEERKIRMLADAFPVPVALDELKALVGDSLDFSSLADRNDIKGIELVMAAMKLVNKKLSESKIKADQVEGQVKAIEKMIPQEFDPESVRGISSADLARELAQIQQHNRLVDEVQSNLAKVERAKGGIENQIQQVNAQIANLQAELEQLSSRLRQSEAKVSEHHDWLAGNPRQDTDRLQDSLNRLDEQRTILGQYDQMKDLEEQAKQLRDTESSIAKAKKRLSAFPAELTERAQIPIKGLSIEDDRILLNGLPLDNLSDGERLQLAIQVAAAGAGELGIVCIDGAERMSDTQREELLSKLEQQGMQFFVTQVADTDLIMERRVRRDVEAVAVAAVGPAAEVSPASVAASLAAEEAELSHAVDEDNDAEKTATESLRELFAEANVQSPLTSDAHFSNEPDPLDEMPGFTDTSEPSVEMRKQSESEEDDGYAVAEDFVSPQTEAAEQYADMPGFTAEETGATDSEGYEQANDFYSPQPTSSNNDDGYGEIPGFDSGLPVVEDQIPQRSAEVSVTPKPIKKPEPAPESADDEFNFNF